MEVFSFELKLQYTSFKSNICVDFGGGGGEGKVGGEGKGRGTGRHVAT